jgi:hypothetical protein
MAEQNRMESIKVEGGQLIDHIKRLVHEGNVRRIVIKQGERTVVEFPLTIGVVGVMLAPVLAAAGALAALLTDCTIEVEREAETAALNDQSPVAALDAVVVASDGTPMQSEPAIELTAP